MTGYGKAEAVWESGKMTVEIRTLNGKSADINIKSPLLPKDKEISVRQQLAQALKRGTIDFYMSWEPNSADAGKKLNTDLLKAYFTELWQVRDAVSETVTHRTGSPQDTALLLSAALRIPDVVDSHKQDVVTEENWPLVQQAIDAAIDAVRAFRSREGAALYQDVTGRVAKILAMEDQVEALEGERIATVRERLLNNLEELAQKPDQQRFEQEMIYYLEKLDINEEKVRLRQHCRYFMDTIDGEENPGKKLGFIIQEMGREINTTGSKANHAGIQKVVVLMKDELEKIREQSMNIL